MPPPPPPPPLPGSGGGPPPPPPPGGPSLTQGFKIVPGLGDALHEMKRRISGVEETPACAEGEFCKLFKICSFLKVWAKRKRNHYELVQ